MEAHDVGGNAQRSSHTTTAHWLAPRVDGARCSRRVPYTCSGASPSATPYSSDDRSNASQKWWMRLTVLGAVRFAPTPPFIPPSYISKILLPCSGSSRVMVVGDRLTRTDSNEPGFPLSHRSTTMSPPTVSERLRASIATPGLHHELYRPASRVPLHSDDEIRTGDPATITRALESHRCSRIIGDFARPEPL